LVYSRKRDFCKFLNFIIFLPRRQAGNFINNALIFNIKKLEHYNLFKNYKIKKLKIVFYVLLPHHSFPRHHRSLALADSQTQKP
jgi:hypothetical protein